jgi:hypothetical protein
MAWSEGSVRPGARASPGQVGDAPRRSSEDTSARRAPLRWRWMRACPGRGSLPRLPFSCRDTVDGRRIGSGHRRGADDEVLPKADTRAPESVRGRRHELLPCRGSRGRTPGTTARASTLPGKPRPDVVLAGVSCVLCGRSSSTAAGWSGVKSGAWSSSVWGFAAVGRVR